MIQRLIKISSILILLISFQAYAGADYDDWEGDVSSDWNNANNWEGNSLPATNQVARINPSNYTNAPVISSASSFTPRYLEVTNDGVLTINAAFTTSRQGGVTGGGDIIINSGGSYTCGNAYDIGLEDDGSTITVAGGTLDAGDDLVIDGNNDGTGAQPQLIVTSGTVNIGGDIQMGGDSDELPNLTVSGGTINVTNDIIHLGGDVCPIDIDLSGTGAFDIGGSIVMDEASDSFTATGGSIDMSSNNPESVTNNGSISMTGGTFTSSTTLEITGTGTYSFYNLSIAATESFEQSVASISVGGDWDNDGTFTPNSNSVTFNGSVDQDLDGAGTTFYNVTLNNSAGNLNFLSDMTVSNSLTMTQGLIVCDSTNNLTINDNATISGASSTSYVDGYMRKVGNDDFVFPLGDAGMYMPLEISSATGTNASDVFEAQYVRGVNPNAFWDSLSYAGNPGGMYNTSILDYWTLYRTNGTAQPFITLHWQNGDSSQIDDLVDLVVAHYTGSDTWEDLGNGSTSGTTAAGSVTSSSRATSFSPFTFGSSSNSSNPLPITLLEFDAKPIGDVVNVIWKTVSEINNNYFEIERSTDGINYSAIKKIDGAGNSQIVLEYEIVDENPVAGKYSYYRLKQTDFDGKYSYSRVVSVFVGDKQFQPTEMIVYPNPVQGKDLFIRSNAFVDNDVKLHVFDMMGKLVSSNVILGPESGSNLISIHPPEKSGMYIIQALVGNEKITRRFSVE